MGGACLPSTLGGKISLESGISYPIAMELTSWFQRNPLLTTQCNQENVHKHGPLLVLDPTRVSRATSSCGG